MWTEGAGLWTDRPPRGGRGGDDHQDHLEAHEERAARSSRRCSVEGETPGLGLDTTPLLSRSEPLASCWVFCVDAQLPSVTNQSAIATDNISAATLKIGLLGTLRQ